MRAKKQKIDECYSCMHTSSHERISSWLFKNKTIRKYSKGAILEVCVCAMCKCRGHGRYMCEYTHTHTHTHTHTDTDTDALREEDTGEESEPGGLGA